MVIGLLNTGLDVPASGLGGLGSPGTGGLQGGIHREMALNPLTSLPLLFWCLRLAIPSAFYQEVGGCVAVLLSAFIDGQFSLFGLWG